MPAKGARGARSRIEAESWEGVDRDALRRLRGCGSTSRAREACRPYVIFHDATLRELARLRPASIAALLGVKGVGARKAEDLGPVFLEAIRADAP